VRIADQKNFLTGIVYLAFGAAVAVGSLSYPIGVARQMGPGYFPLAVSLALVLTGFIVLLGSLKNGATQSESRRWALRPVFGVTVAVVAFGLMLKPFGLIAAAVVLLGISSLADAGFSWWRLMASVAALLPITWAVFIKLLGLQISLLPSFLVG
jgi:hypothetical protein